MSNINGVAKFRATSDATAEDWAIIEQSESRWRRSHGPTDGLLSLMASIEHADSQGAPVNLYNHCLQAASRALKDHADEEMIVVALFHDLPEAISDNDHGAVAAQLLAPWISEHRVWLLEHHVEFQNFYFANHPTRNRNARDRYVDHACYAETDYFCRVYDQAAFDPDYPTLRLETFEPIVRSFFTPPIPAARILST